MSEKEKTPVEKWPQAFVRQTWINDPYVLRAMELNHCGWMDVTRELREEAKRDMFRRFAEDFNRAIEAMGSTWTKSLKK